jgi:hypothetical protein
MDGGMPPAAILALDVRARAAVSGAAARMRLILGVFGVAVVLIVVWVILWVMGTRNTKDSDEN